MPEFSEILDTALEAVANSTDRQELRRLRAHVEAIKQLAGAEPGTDELLELVGTEEAPGYLPHYNHAARATLSASLAMSTSRKRETTAGGEVQIGPIALRGEMSNAFGQDTATNLQVTVELERRLVSQSYGDLLNALQIGGG